MRRNKVLVGSVVLAQAVIAAFAVPAAASEEGAAPGGVTQTVYEAGSADCEHKYERQEDSKEATETEGGYRHYICGACGEEYAYTTDPLVYADGYEKYDGSVVDVNEGNIGAANPYLPLWDHTCDGEPRVYWSKTDGEWRVYIYASLDAKAVGMCSWNYEIWSAPVYDLSNWRFESSVGAPSDSPVAGDCAYNLQNDKYYFAKGLPGSIWVSDSPSEGFDDTVVFQDAGENMDSLMLFDPALHINERGEMYMFSSQWSDLNYYNVSRMSEDYSSIADNYVIKNPNGSLLTGAYEGPSIRYLDEYGVYVMVYASVYSLGKDTDWHTVMSYAWTRDIDSPNWKYGGLLYDTSGHFLKNIESGEIEFDKTQNTANYENNHGGLVKINGQYYIFGHRNTFYTIGSRQGLAEKLDVSYDEATDTLAIKPVEMTSSGLADYLDAYQVIDAAHECYMTPAVDVGSGPAGLYVGKNPVDADSASTHAFPIVGISNNTVVGFKYLNFGDAEVNAGLRMLFAKEAETADGTVSVYLDAPSGDEGGTLIGRMEITEEKLANAEQKETGTSGTEWSWLETDLDEPLSGIHGVYFVFAAEGRNTICSFDQFEFVSK